MTGGATTKLVGYAALAAIGLVAAVAVGRAELVVLVAPFALAAGVGIALGRRPRLHMVVEPGPERALQGEVAPLGVRIESEDAVPTLELTVAVAPGLEVEGRARAVRLRAGEPRDIVLPLRCARWGGYRPGPVAVRARDPLGFAAWEARAEVTTPLRVYPHEEALRAVVPPAETQVFVGSEVARARGDGIEFADLRPFIAGDRVRRINWRASARRAELWVNEAHPERNADVVLFLDTFAEARLGATGTLDLAVRAAASLVSRYLARNDRIGLVSFGGILRWLVPAGGVTQLYRLVDSLLDSEIALSYAWKNVDVIPPRTLPPKALVVALTPLLDERSITALLDLRARGFDLAIVDVSPIPFAGEGRSTEERLARRIWALRREGLRVRFREVGVAVTEWRAGTPFAAAVEEVTSFRRAARLVRA